MLKTLRILPAALLLFATLAIATPAQAEHVCYTPGDVQVCTFIPGDELLDSVGGCQTIGDYQFCIEAPSLTGTQSHRCYTLGNLYVCTEIPGDEVVDQAVEILQGLP